MHAHCSKKAHALLQNLAHVCNSTRTCPKSAGTFTKARALFSKVRAHLQKLAHIYKSSRTFTKAHVLLQMLAHFGTFETNRTASHGFWSYIKSKTQDVHQIKQLYSNPTDKTSELVFDDAEKAQVLNNYFSSIIISLFRTLRKYNIVFKAHEKQQKKKI